MEDWPCLCNSLQEEHQLLASVRREKKNAYLSPNKYVSGLIQHSRAFSSDLMNFNRLREYCADAKLTGTGQRSSFIEGNSNGALIVMVA